MITPQSPPAAVGRDGMNCPSTAAPAHAFARWYWRRVKEVPVVVASFALGGAYVAFLMIVPQLAVTAVRIAWSRL